ncbi:uncharacterized protein MONBRDRAFT_37486 [Monosiga brevicollis MX1]|uniref:Uncharacterized protein n=1 Tax=Monosiga brevicollis TaxID=81824 RepID=A9V216_MONBE|nr:uncharacterized protein MONBRDRAFT_37486 [Monosiga brevicollis MX1]EDQ88535.1 predicted protein [Monosiga brevicollis MX1]|eukprot:XP_001746639.1 hypothetical protein [Monosiga brevicollis MX1]
MHKRLPLALVSALTLALTFENGLALPSSVCASLRASLPAGPQTDSLVCPELSNLDDLHTGCDKAVAAKLSNTSFTVAPTAIHHCSFVEGPTQPIDHRHLQTAHISNATFQAFYSIEFDASTASVAVHVRLEVNLTLSGSMAGYVVADEDPHYLWAESRLVFPLGARPIALWQAKLEPPKEADATELVLTDINAMDGLPALIVAGLGAPHSHPNSLLPASAALNILNLPPRWLAPLWDSPSTLNLAARALLPRALPDPSSPRLVGVGGLLSYDGVLAPGDLLQIDVLLAEPEERSRLAADVATQLELMLDSALINASLPCPRLRNESALFDALQTMNDLTLFVNHSSAQVIFMGLSFATHVTIDCGTTFGPEMSEHRPFLSLSLEARLQKITGLPVTFFAAPTLAVSMLQSLDVPISGRASGVLVNGSTSAANADAPLVALQPAQLFSSDATSAPAPDFALTNATRLQSIFDALRQELLTLVPSDALPLRRAIFRILPDLNSSFIWDRCAAKAPLPTLRSCLFDALTAHADLDPRFTPSNQLFITVHLTGKDSYDDPSSNLNATLQAVNEQIQGLNVSLGALNLSASELDFDADTQADLSYTLYAELMIPCLTDPSPTAHVQAEEVHAMLALQAPSYGRSIHDNCGEDARNCSLWALDLNATLDLAHTPRERPTVSIGFPALGTSARALSTGALSIPRGRASLPTTTLPTALSDTAKAISTPLETSLLTGLQLSQYNDLGPLNLLEASDFSSLVGDSLTEALTISNGDLPSAEAALEHILAQLLGNSSAYYVQVSASLVAAGLEPGADPVQTATSLLSVDLLFAVSVHTFLSIDSSTTPWAGKLSTERLNLVVPLVTTLTLALDLSPTGPSAGGQRATASLLRRASTVIGGLHLAAHLSMETAIAMTAEFQLALAAANGMPDSNSKATLSINATLSSEEVVNLEASISSLGSNATALDLAFPRLQQRKGVDPDVAMAQFKSLAGLPATLLRSANTPVAPGLDPSRYHDLSQGAAELTAALSSALQRPAIPQPIVAIAKSVATADLRNVAKLLLNVTLVDDSMPTMPPTSSFQCILEEGGAVLDYSSCTHLVQSLNAQLESCGVGDILRFTSNTVVNFGGACDELSSLSLQIAHPGGLIPLTVSTIVPGSEATHVLDGLQGRIYNDNNTAPSCTSWTSCAQLQQGLIDSSARTPAVKRTTVSAKDAASLFPFSDAVTLDLRPYYPEAFSAVQLPPAQLPAYTYAQNLTRATELEASSGQLRVLLGGAQGTNGQAICPTGGPFNRTMRRRSKNTADAPQNYAPAEVTVSLSTAPLIVALDTPPQVVNGSIVLLSLPLNVSLTAPNSSNVSLILKTALRARGGVLLDSWNHNISFNIPNGSLVQEVFCPALRAAIPTELRTILRCDVSEYQDWRHLKRVTRLSGPPPEMLQVQLIATPTLANSSIYGDAMLIPEDLQLNNSTLDGLRMTMTAFPPRFAMMVSDLRVASHVEVEMPDNTKRAYVTVGPIAMGARHLAGSAKLNVTVQQSSATSLTRLEDAIRAVAQPSMLDMAGLEVLVDIHGEQLIQGLRPCLSAVGADDLAAVDIKMHAGVAATLPTSSHLDAILFGTSQRAGSHLYALATNLSWEVSFENGTGSGRQALQSLLLADLQLPCKIARTLAQSSAEAGRQQLAQTALPFLTASLAKPLDHALSASLANAAGSLCALTYATLDDLCIQLSSFLSLPLICGGGASALTFSNNTVELWLTADNLNATTPTTVAFETAFFLNESSFPEGVSILPSESMFGNVRINATVSLSLDPRASNAREDCGDLSMPTMPVRFAPGSHLSLSASFAFVGDACLYMGPLPVCFRQSSIALEEATLAVMLNSLSPPPSPGKRSHHKAPRSQTPLHLQPLLEPHVLFEGRARLDGLMEIDSDYCQLTLEVHNLTAYALALLSWQHTPGNESNGTAPDGTPLHIGSMHSHELVMYLEALQEQAGPNAPFSLSSINCPGHILNDMLMSALARHNIQNNLANFGRFESQLKDSMRSAVEPLLEDLEALNLPFVNTFGIDAIRDGLLDGLFGSNFFKKLLELLLDILVAIYDGVEGFLESFTALLCKILEIGGLLNKEDCPPAPKPLQYPYQWRLPLHLHLHPCACQVSVSLGANTTLASFNLCSSTHDLSTWQDASFFQDHQNVSSDMICADITVHAWPNLTIDTDGVSIRWPYDAPALNIELEAEFDNLSFSGYFGRLAVEFGPDNQQGAKGHVGFAAPVWASPPRPDGKQDLKLGVPSRLEASLGGRAAVAYLSSDPASDPASDFDASPRIEATIAAEFDIEDGVLVVHKLHFEDVLICLASLAEQLGGAFDFMDHGFIGFLRQTLDLLRTPLPLEPLITVSILDLLMMYAYVFTTPFSNLSHFIAMLDDLGETFDLLKLLKEQLSDATCKTLYGVAEVFSLAFSTIEQGITTIGDMQFNIFSDSGTVNIGDALSFFGAVFVRRDFGIYLPILAAEGLSGYVGREVLGGLDALTGRAPDVAAIGQCDTLLLYASLPSIAAEIGYAMPLGVYGPLLASAMIKLTGSADMGEYYVCANSRQPLSALGALSGLSVDTYIPTVNSRTNKPVQPWKLSASVAAGLSADAMFLKASLALAVGYEMFNEIYSPYPGYSTLNFLFRVIHANSDKLSDSFIRTQNFYAQISLGVYVCWFVPFKRKCSEVLGASAQYNFISHKRTPSFPETLADSNGHIDLRNAAAMDQTGEAGKLFAGLAQTPPRLGYPAVAASFTAVAKANDAMTVAETVQGKALSAVHIQYTDQPYVFETSNMALPIATLPRGADVRVLSFSDEDPLTGTSQLEYTIDAFGVQPGGGMGQLGLEDGCESLWLVAPQDNAEVSLKGTPCATTIDAFNRARVNIVASSVTDFSSGAVLVATSAGAWEHAPRMDASAPLHHLATSGSNIGPYSILIAVSDVIEIDLTGTAVTVLSQVAAATGVSLWGPKYGPLAADDALNVRFEGAKSPKFLEVQGHRLLATTVSINSVLSATEATVTGIGGSLICNVNLDAIAGSLNVAGSQGQANSLNITMSVPASSAGLVHVSPTSIAKQVGGSNAQALGSGNQTAVTQHVTVANIALRTIQLFAGASASLKSVVSGSEQFSVLEVHAHGEVNSHLTHQVSKCSSHTAGNTYYLDGGTQTVTIGDGQLWGMNCLIRLIAPPKPDNATSVKGNYSVVLNATQEPQGLTWSMSDTSAISIRGTDGSSWVLQLVAENMDWVALHLGPNENKVDIVRSPISPTEVEIHFPVSHKGPQTLLAESLNTAVLVTGSVNITAGPSNSDNLDPLGMWLGMLAICQVGLPANSTPSMAPQALKLEGSGPAAPSQQFYFGNGCGGQAPFRNSTVKQPYELPSDEMMARMAACGIDANMRLCPVVWAGQDLTLGFTTGPKPDFIWINDHCGNTVIQSGAGDDTVVLSSGCNKSTIQVDAGMGSDNISVICPLNGGFVDFTDDHDADTLSLFIKDHHTSLIGTILQDIGGVSAGGGALSVQNWRSEDLVMIRGQENALVADATSDAGLQLSQTSQVDNETAIAPHVIDTREGKSLSMAWELASSSRVEVIGMCAGCFLTLLANANPPPVNATVSVNLGSYVNGSTVRLLSSIDANLTLEFVTANQTDDFGALLVNAGAAGPVTGGSIRYGGLYIETHYLGALHIRQGPASLSFPQLVVNGVPSQAPLLVEGHSTRNNGLDLVVLDSPLIVSVPQLKIAPSVSQLHEAGLIIAVNGTELVVPEGWADEAVLWQGCLQQPNGLRTDSAIPNSAWIQAQLAARLPGGVADAARAINTPCPVFYGGAGPTYLPVRKLHISDLRPSWLVNVTMAAGHNPSDPFQTTEKEPEQTLIINDTLPWPSNAELTLGAGGHLTLFGVFSVQCGQSAEVMITAAQGVAPTLDKLDVACLDDTRLPVRYQFGADGADDWLHWNASDGGCSGKFPAQPSALSLPRALRFLQAALQPRQDIELVFSPPPLSDSKVQARSLLLNRSGLQVYSEPADAATSMTIDWSQRSERVTKCAVHLLDGANTFKLQSLGTAVVPLVDADAKATVNIELPADMVTVFDSANVRVDPSKRTLYPSTKAGFAVVLGLISGVIFSVGWCPPDPVDEERQYLINSSDGEHLEAGELTGPDTDSSGTKDARSYDRQEPAHAPSPAQVSSSLLQKVLLVCQWVKRGTSYRTLLVRASAFWIPTLSAAFGRVGSASWPLVWYVPATLGTAVLAAQLMSRTRLSKLAWVLATVYFALYMYVMVAAAEGAALDNHAYAAVLAFPPTFIVATITWTLVETGCTRRGTRFALIQQTSDVQ